MPTPGGTWLHLKRWCGHLPGSALFDSFCYKFVLYPTYCNTLLCEWIIKEPRKHLKVIAVRRGTSLLKKTGRISRSVKVLLYAPWRKHQVRFICDGIVSMDLVTEGWMSRHIPIELSSTLRFFVKHGGKISVKVSQKNYRASNLEQGGLEVPFYCVLCDFLPGRTTHEKTETDAGGILAFQTRVSTTKQERKRVNNATRTRIHCCAATIRWFFSFSFLNVY